MTCARCGQESSQGFYTAWRGDARLYLLGTETLTSVFLATNEDDAPVFCEECLLRTFTVVRCTGCAELTTAVDSALCDACYDNGRDCDGCNERFLSDGEDARFCPTCTEFVRECQICGTETTHHPLCEVCSVADLTDIHPYHFKPDLLFHGRGPWYMGIELEVEYPGLRSDLVKVVRDSPLMPLIYLKTDGSLNHGVELVTHPMSWEFFRSKLPDFRVLLRVLTKEGATSWDSHTCGMHIHVSRKVWSTLQTYRLLKFVYTNKRFVADLSGRRVGELDAYASLVGDVESAVRKAKNGSGDSRYEAVNLDNSTTIEFRIFRGTLSFPRFARNAEFVRAVWEFTREASNLTPMDYETFAGWLKERTKKFPALAAWVERYSNKTS